MHHYCTYFDINYLTRGLALYGSLTKHERGEFVFWVLCFDDPTYTLLSCLSLPGVRLISLEEFERWDPQLRNTKDSRSEVEYYWTCTPSLPLYVLEKDPEIELISYLDADLYFFSDPGVLYDELGSRSALIIEHRFPTEMHHLENNGIFNVGMLIFRRDGSGLGALQWWRERCIEWCYAKHEEGKFGDQKYLDDWPTRFNSVVVSQHKGAGAGPWNICRYKTRREKNRVMVDGQSLVFYHFHGYHGISRHAAVPADSTYSISPKQIKQIYQPYSRALEEVENRVASLKQTLPSGSLPSWPPKLVHGLLYQRFFLLRPHWL